MTEAEVPLTGGRITEGIVRVGDTVRRPLKSGAVDLAELLAYLSDHGFEGAPRYLGLDGKGRVTLSFLEGQVPQDLAHFEDDQLTAAAALLRRFHDATTNYPGVVAAGAEVICHNDFGPPNAVFRDRLPYALIDFDTSAPGSRLWDLGYSAFSWLDLGNGDYTGPEQLRRLELFTTAYSHHSCPTASVAIHAVARQSALSALGDRRGDITMRDWAADAARWTVANVLEALCPSGMWPHTASRSP